MLGDFDIIYVEFGCMGFWILWVEVVMFFYVVKDFDYLCCMFEFDFG